VKSVIKHFEKKQEASSLNTLKRFLYWTKLKLLLLVHTLILFTKHLLMLTFFCYYGLWIKWMRSFNLCFHS